jgi:predicted RNase H-like HicB family nuclease
MGFGHAQLALAGDVLALLLDARCGIARDVLVFDAPVEESLRHHMRHDYVEERREALAAWADAVTAAVAAAAAKDKAEAAAEYPASIEPDGAGRFLVRFPDLPEALTDGATIEEAMDEAADCLAVAISSRVDDGEPVPEPSRVRSGQYLVAPRLKGRQ